LKETGTRCIIEPGCKSKIHVEKEVNPMSKQAVQEVIGKAVTDSEFREALFANPDEALAGYQLTEDEIVALKSVDAETMESFAGSLDERISKAFVAGLMAGTGPQAIVDPTQAALLGLVP
jgi:hypothetical protein